MVINSGGWIGQSKRRSKTQNKQTKKPTNQPTKQTNKTKTPQQKATNKKESHSVNQNKQTKQRPQSKKQTNKQTKSHSAIPLSGTTTSQSVNKANQRSPTKQTVYSYLFFSSLIFVLVKWILIVTVLSICLSACLTVNLIIIIIIIIIMIIAFQGTIRDWLQSPHCASNRLQHVRSSGPGAIVCKSRATHRALITCNMSCYVPRGTKGQLSY